MRVQRRIADLLDRADSVLLKRREAQRLTDDLLHSAFSDLFGDPVTNERDWPEASLESIAEVRSGIAKGRVFSGQETVQVPYMRVANVQDGYLSLDDIEQIEMLPMDVPRCQLQAGDILLTEGGDPDKLGRGAVWQGAISPCVHQNHVFRLRCDTSRILPEFASALLGSDRGKRYFAKAAKQTTGIATINMTQLRATPLFVPPMDLQARWRALVGRAQLHANDLAAHEATLSALPRALARQAFGDEAR